MGFTNDSWRFGFPRTIVPSPTGATGAFIANSGWFYRLIEGGQISKIRIEVITSSGNICVGAYQNMGAGLNAAPGALYSSSGIVACPVAGVTNIPLSNTIQVYTGDWLAISCDNATATFGGSNGVGNGISSAGQIGSANAQMPLTANPVIGYSNNRMAYLIGVA